MASPAVEHVVEPAVGPAVDLQARHPPAALQCHGGDLAAGIVECVEREEARNEDFNISTAESTTVLELAELIWHKVKGPDEPFRHVSDPGFTHDVQKRVPDVTKAKQVLGVEATTTLSDMLDEVIPWIAQAIKDGSI